MSLKSVYKCFLMFESLLLFVVVFVNSYLCSILCVYSVVAHRIYTCTQQCWHNIISSLFIIIIIILFLIINYINNNNIIKKNMKKNE